MISGHKDNRDKLMLYRKRDTETTSLNQSSKRNRNAKGDINERNKSKG
jgi:hypothetical protein